MRGTKVEPHALPAHDRVETSGLENLNYVIRLPYVLEARLTRVQAIYLKRF